MKRFLIALSVFLVWSVFGLWVFSWIHPDDETAQLNTKPNLDTKIDSLATKKPIKVVDSPNKSSTKQESIKEILDTEIEPVGLQATNEEGDIIFSFSQGISILKNKSEVEIPIAIIDYKYKLNTYIIEHPKKEVHIHSLYSPKEGPVHPNIGLQRGNELKKILIDFGIPSERIVVKPVIKDIAFTNSDSYKNSIYFTFHPLDEERIKAIKEREPKTKTVYPTFSDSGILANKELKKLLGELIIYFNEDPNKKIEIVGHTDNIGSEIDNYAIGLKYAKQVRWYLVSRGDLNGNLIKASSKGETEPIEDNNTSKGRIANRRVEVIFK